MKLLRAALTAAAILILFTPASTVGSRAFAQGITTGVIIGTVADQQGAVIPQATISAVDVASGANFKTESDANGLFSLRNLPIGVYDLTIESGSFSPLQVKALRITAGVTNDIGIRKMTVSNTSTVTVESAAPVLETSHAQVTTSFEPEQLQGLPLNTSFDNVALLAPGVAQTHDANFSNSNGDGISANGQRGRSNNFELDGQNNNDNSVGGPQVFFGNADALAEIQVITNNFGAQYGRNMGSIVNYVTNSGTNTFHGSGFEYYTGSWLSSLQNGQKTPLDGFCAPGEDPADGCTPVTVPRSVDNKYGGTFGGPIIKDKLWFFGSTYWDRTRDGGAVSTSQGALTPTPNGLATLQSAFPNNPAVTSLVNQGPYGITNGNPTPIASAAEMIPVTVGGNTANVEFAPVQRTVPALLNDQEDMGRLDWQPSTKDRFFIRYFYQDETETGGLANGATAIASGGYVDILDTAHSIGADWTHTFSPAWVNQLRYSYEQTKSYFQGGGVPNCTAANLTACPSQVSFQDPTIFGYGYNSALPQDKIIKVTQVQDNASWLHGKHTIALGGEYDYQNSPSVYLPNYNGSLQYADFDSFAADTNGSLTLTDGNPVIPLTENDIALYFQDDWKITQALTLNLGLRWEYFGQAVNELHDMTLKRETGPNPFWDPSLPLSVRTFQQVPDNWKNFQPRIGFAWNPANSRLVVRGGYAINFDPSFYNIFTNAAIQAPVANSGFVNCAAGSPCLPADGTTGATVRAQNLASLPVGGDPRFDVESPLLPHFRNPYTQTYSLGIQYGIGDAAVIEVRYVGNHATALFQAIDANPTLTDLATSFPTYASPGSLCQDQTAPGYGTRNCNVGALQAAVGNTAFSNYNSLQANLTTRAFHGLTGTMQYTYSRTIDNASEILPTGAGGQTLEFAQNPLNTNLAERGVSGISYPNVFAFGFGYAVPSLAKESSMVGKLANGYSISAIYGYNSGQPFTPYQGLQANGTFCDDYFNQYVLAVSSCRPTLTNPAAPNSPNSWQDTDQLTAIAAGNPFPGVGRNTLRGQSYNNLDADIYKTTSLGEHAKLQLQLSVFNVLNRQFLGTPGAFVGASDFLTGAYNTGSNRTVQLGGKITF
ncbi:TonB-dependent receptor [Silvibacterium acidisoli]|uniref:TonB-dependent receptor n=1 Tax=Acidobacteriaceae bacterium ZG23-2 TaxID=2883246 RepID=UPI00406C2010